MKKILLSTLVVLLSPMELALANELKIHVIEPNIRIDWSSPSALGITSGLNSLGNDYAPIGHFAVEINCTNPNQYGVRHVLTGMERYDKDESRRITMEKKLGLGSLIYPFVGSLQSSKDSLDEMNLARKDGRMKTISILTSAARCNAMLEFMDKWIQAGSYTVYGGMKNVSAGEGAGCADFAMKFFEIATGTLPPREWHASVKVPKALIGDGRNHQVSFLSILNRTSWASRSEPSLAFRIGDTNLTSDWIKERTKPGTKFYYYINHLFPTGTVSAPGTDILAQMRAAAQRMSNPPALKPFRYQYTRTVSPATSWKEISRGR